jgi:hypothetical protein
MPNKLFVYNLEYLDIGQAIGRFGWPTNLTPDPEITMLPITSKQDVFNALDGYLAKRMVFNRVLFQTHGDAGLAWFGNDEIHDYSWKWFENKGYEKLFPTYSRIYFDGCDIADGKEGVKFLRAAGRVFLKGQGGEVVGWTSFGLGLPGIVPFIGGHTIHPFGDVVKVIFAPGDTVGTLAPPPETPAEDPPYYPGGA